jgi:hypothetical protein
LLASIDECSADTHCLNHITFILYALDFFVQALDTTETNEVHGVSVREATERFVMSQSVSELTRNLAFGDRPRSLDSALHSPSLPNLGVGIDPGKANGTPGLPLRCQALLGICWRRLIVMGEVI